MKKSKVTLKLEKITPADYAKKQCPAEYYKIMVNRKQVGELDFRIGQTKHLCMYAGQLGFTILEEFRGNGYAAQALAAVLPHCFKYYPEVFVTCKSNNIASKKTIETVGAKYLGIVQIPKTNKMYHSYGKVHRYSISPKTLY